MDPIDEATIRGLEDARLRSLVDADLEVARALHADDYELITPGAARYSKDDYLGAIEDGTLDYRVFEAEADVAVLLAGQAAAVRYVARIDIRFPGGTDSGRFWHTDVWRLRDGRWQAVWSQATSIPARE
ncbi:MAG TPA: nuclear transport factor 2 family protein [Candidatus Limnocylindrales bacterium]|nr:nuclear transport factor 2 family protein [Candidatus Limnocylindrales bacterium]